VRAGGTLVTIIGPPTVRPADGRAIFFVVEPDRLQLEHLAERVWSGRLHPIIGAVRPLPRQWPRSRPTAGYPARRSSASQKANDGRRVSDRSADRSRATCSDT
jgi:hypothetical protein